MHRPLSLAVTTLGLHACTAGGPAADIPPFVPCRAPALHADQPVELSATGQLVLDGEPLVPHGVGSYPLLEHVGNGELEKVRDIFAQAVELGRPIVRTNAFMDGGSNPGRIRDANGEIREQGLVALDHLLDEARQAGVRLLLVLTNNWSDYGGAPAVLEAVAPGENLPKDAFWSDPRALDAQQTYIQTLVSRTNSLNGRPYAQDATVFAWELANEARCTDKRYCGRNTLPSWAEKMGDAVRNAGATQLVSWGGAGSISQYGERLEDIGATGAVDLLTVHVYPGLADPWGEQLPTLSQRLDFAASKGSQRIRAAYAVAERLALPLLIEEFGWRPPSTGEARDMERALVYRDWLAVAHELGLATMPWMIGETGRPDYDGFLIRPQDLSTWGIIRCE